MLKIRNTPKKLLSCGFIGLRIKSQYEMKNRTEICDWILSLLSENDYYAQHDGVYFVRIEGIESMLLLKYPESIKKIYTNPREWAKE